MVCNYLRNLYVLTFLIFLLLFRRCQDEQTLDYININFVFNPYINIGQIIVI